MIAWKALHRSLLVQVGELFIIANACLSCLLNASGRYPMSVYNLLESTVWHGRKIVRPVVVRKDRLLDVIDILV